MDCWVEGLNNDVEGRWMQEFKERRRPNAWKIGSHMKRRYLANKVIGNNRSVFWKYIVTCLLHPNRNFKPMAVTFCQRDRTAGLLMLWCIFFPSSIPSTNHRTTILCVLHSSDITSLLPSIFYTSSSFLPRSAHMLCRPWHVQHNHTLVPSLFWNCWWTPLSHTSSDRIYSQSLAFSSLSSSLLLSLCLLPIFPHPI